jgi:hypothetical protein
VKEVYPPSNVSIPSDSGNRNNAAYRLPAVLVNNEELLMSGAWQIVRPTMKRGEDHVLEISEFMLSAVLAEANEEMRIQLELSESQFRDLKAMMKDTENDTYKELFNNALSLLQWATDEVKVGNVIAAVAEKEDKYRVLVMPALERAARGARHELERAETKAS